MKYVLKHIFDRRTVFLTGGILEQEDRELFFLDRRTGEQDFTGEIY